MSRCPTFVLLAVLVAGCAARVPPRPGGTAAPDPSAEAAFTQATRQCASLNNVTAELRLSGRAGDEKIGGTLHAGLAAPGSIRFEAMAPFGAPVFILAGRNDRATLLFPRDDRVLPDAGVAEILERLTGLSLGAGELRLILTGCLVEHAAPAEGRAWPGGWRAVTIGPQVTAYLKDVNGAPAVVAADRGTWRIDYANHRNGFPRSVRIRSGDAANTAVVDLTAAIDQLEVNAGIDERAFTVDIPANAERLTLANLRSIAPLRETK